MDTPRTSDEGSIKYYEYFMDSTRSDDYKPSTIDSVSPKTIPDDNSSQFARSLGSQKRHRYNAFELNVPEHLPSSPICPKNPK